MSIAVDRAVVGVFEMSFLKDDSCSSSIGKDSEDDEASKGDDEVQSKFNTFDSLQALEEVLPIRRGISSFYSGKSKSFASLSHLSPSARDIAKPDNAYSRKRRNLMASASHVQLHRSHGGGIHKRSMHTSRSTLALVLAMSRSSSSSSSSSASSEDSNCSRSGSQSHLPPLHPS